MRIAVFTIILSVGEFASSAFSQNSPPLPTVQVISKEVSADVVQPNAHREVRLDLGDLPAGKRIEVLVHLTNRSQFDFTIKNTEVMCSCIDLRASPERMKIGETIKCFLKLDVPKISEKSHREERIQIKTDFGEFPFYVSYQIEDLICFRERAISVHVDKKAKLYKFNALAILTKAHEPKDVLIEFSPEMEGTTYSLRHDEGEQWLIDLQVPIKPNERYGKTGVITIRSLKSPLLDRMACVLELPQTAIISPSILRFEESPSSESCWKSHAIARVMPGNLLFSDKDDPQSDSRLVFSAKVGSSRDWKMTVQPIRLSAGIYRLELELNRTSQEKVDKVELPKLVQWTIDGAKENIVIESGIRF